MKKELLEFIKENDLSIFKTSKTQLKNNSESHYKTKDAKSIHTKTFSHISKNFVFTDTSNLLNFFKFTKDPEEIRKRHDFFKKIKEEKINNDFLKKLIFPRQWWKPDYEVLVVTEDTETYNKLKEINCPTKLLISEMDITLLEKYDVVQVLDCPEYGRILENLPQTVFLSSTEEAYLERHLEKFSGWKENLEILEKNKTNEKIKEKVESLIPLINFIKKEETKIISRDDIEILVEKINDKISEKLKSLTISGEDLIPILSKGLIPEEIKKQIRESIKETGCPENIFIMGLPVKIDEEELEKTIQSQSANEFSNKSEKIKKESQKIRNIPEIIKTLEKELLLFDFSSGISQFIDENMTFPTFNENIELKNSKNIFLENAQGISFYLNEIEKCSILTGANSGGKTTLIEHIIQIYTLFQTGLPISGETKIPIFTDIYYFAKNKGSMSKGAFETLLTQMSFIKPGEKTLILADEIESVTEPGVAGEIISATAEYFVKKNCFMIIATHLGHEIKKSLPEKCRIDGIEAKGLDKDFNLIVDHNPVIGRIANSTPELIVEKMANAERKPYFIYLHEFLKQNKSL